MMNFSVVQEPSQARIKDVRSREDAIRFIEEKKEKGFESDSVFHLNGRIDILLFKGVDKRYLGFAKPVE